MRTNIAQLDASAGRTSIFSRTQAMILSTPKSTCAARCTNDLLSLANSGTKFDAYCPSLTLPALAFFCVARVQREARISVSWLNGQPWHGDLSMRREFGIFERSSPMSQSTPSLRSGFQCKSLDHHQTESTRMSIVSSLLDQLETVRDQSDLAISKKQGADEASID